MLDKPSPNLQMEKRMWRGTTWRLDRGVQEIAAQFLMPVMQGLYFRNY